MTFRWLTAMALTMALGMLNQTASSVQAQDKSAVYLPQDSIVVFYLDVAAIKNQKELEVVPWEVLSAAGKDAIGVDPLLATQVWGTVGLPSMNGPEFGIRISTSQPVNIDDLNGEMFGPVKSSAKTPNIKLRPMNGAPISVVQANDTFMVGSEGTLRKLLGAKGTPSNLVALVAADKEPIRLAVAMEPIRELITTSIEQFQFALTEDMASDLKELVTKVDYIYLRSTLGLDVSMTLQFGAADEATASRVKEVLLSLRSQGMDEALMQASGQLEFTPMSEEVKAAWKEYFTRARSIVEKASDPTLKGDRVTFEIKNLQSAYTASFLLGMALPAVQTAREFTTRLNSDNNLKQLGLAFHNYESAYSHFPERAKTDEDGNQLLSWRVLLLPFLEEGRLYEKFNLDEPWDSEQNKALLAEMPDVYKNPRLELPEGYTCYVAPYGGKDEKRTIWDIEKCSFRNVTDGTSNTIMFVQVNADAAVPWTKPDDFDIAAKSLIEFLLERPKGGQATMCDGATTQIGGVVDEEQLEALLGAADGVYVELP